MQTSSRSLSLNGAADANLEPWRTQRKVPCNIQSTLAQDQGGHSQPKPLERGSAKFSLKDVVEEMNEKDSEDGEKHKIKYGVIIDDGDNVIEKNK